MNEKTQAVSGKAIPPSHPLEQKIKDGIVAVSLANLCFISAWFSPLYDSDFGFFNNLPVTPTTLLALLTNIFWFSLVVWLVLQALHRFKSEAFHFVIHLVFFILLFIPVDFLRGQLHPTHSLLSIFKQPVGMLAAVVLLAFVFWKHRFVAVMAARVVAILSPLAVFTIVKIILLCLGVIHLRQSTDTMTFPPLSPVHAGQPRVVWIIFDELDYRLTFEQPPSGVSLPEFHRLQNESLSATNAYSPADKTVISMPSLIAGRRVVMAALTNSSDLFITLYRTGSVVNLKSAIFSRLPTVFSLARARGVNTAVVGWYLPYSRLLSSNLNYCAWHPFPGFEPSSAATYAGALRRQIECLSLTLHIEHGFVQMYRDSMTESLSVVTNGNYGLTLLHLFPPHAPGIYLPAENRFSLLQQTGPKAYLNNLVLADHSLGQLRRAMETSGQWDKTWVIVSADHSWRMSQTYDGRRDFRVPFLVKPAGTNAPATLAQQFNTALTRDLILAILDRDITNTDSLMMWIGEHGKPRPTSKGTFIEGAFQE